VTQSSPHSRDLDNLDPPRRNHKLPPRRFPDASCSMYVHPTHSNPHQIQLPRRSPHLPIPPTPTIALSPRCPPCPGRIKAACVSLPSPVVEATLQAVFCGGVSYHMYPSSAHGDPVFGIRRLGPSPVRSPHIGSLTHGSLPARSPPSISLGSIPIGLSPRDPRDSNRTSHYPRRIPSHPICARRRVLFWHFVRRRSVFSIPRLRHCV
jgi:hypothetical protein